ncbi:hypothetical protein MBAV_003205 [Candidatus Magnetobacterium bavaricum]|uniref:Uncharacterized protein n=1 Tax=Candidatus Magnetobacterium bavaricum TaxID=29290 RepID=A0A0F3GRL8_9BACT|nr:hypothetical protein MBAV_003205 [Candidatus Magnetobacterium bavaricum]
MYFVFNPSCYAERQKKVYSGLIYAVKHVLWPRHYGASRGLVGGLSRGEAPPP